jgi:hypothetical protein
VYAALKYSIMRKKLLQGCRKAERLMISQPLEPDLGNTSGGSVLDDISGTLSFVECQFFYREE